MDFDGRCDLWTRPWQLQPSQSAKMATSLGNADWTDTSMEEAADEGEAGKEGSAVILEDPECHFGVLDLRLKTVEGQ